MVIIFGYLWKESKAPNEYMILASMKMQYRMYIGDGILKRFTSKL